MGGESCGLKQIDIRLNKNMGKKKFSTKRSLCASSRRNTSFGAFYICRPIREVNGDDRFFEVIKNFSMNNKITHDLPCDEGETDFPNVTRFHGTL